MLKTLVLGIAFASVCGVIASIALLAVLNLVARLFTRAVPAPGSSSAHDPSQVPISTPQLARLALSPAVD